MQFLPEGTARSLDLLQERDELRAFGLHLGPLRNGIALVLVVDHRQVQVLLPRT